MDTYPPEIGTASLTIGFGAKPRLLFLYQWFALVMGLACTVAALPVAALSFGCYGAAILLGKVLPLLNTYEFISAAYDRCIERLGQTVLRDQRDTPALRLMVSLTLTVLPVFVIQLWLGKPRFWLVFCFFL